MLLAVSGIVHATPSRRTFDAVISEPVATRWLRRSPLAESHGGAGSVPAVATASPIVVRTSATVAVRYAARPARLPRKLERRVPTAALASAQTTSTPPATKNGAFERSTAAISSVLVPGMRTDSPPSLLQPDVCAARAIRRGDQGRGRRYHREVSPPSSTGIGQMDARAHGRCDHVRRSLP